MAMSTPNIRTEQEPKASVMICDKCGRDNRDDANFCDSCGQSLAHISGRDNVVVAVKSDPDQAIGEITETTTQEQFSRILGGRYELKQMLGQGGMGVVYRAYDQHLGMDIAIKFLLDRLVNDIGAVASLKREAKAAMRLAHPRILRLYNFEDTPEAKFLLMEYVAGESLLSMRSHKPDGKFSEQEVKDYMIDVCEGLSYAHAEGIIHRDIKPSNIMVTLDGQVKLADFGIAHFREAADSQYNLGGGTPIYMSPEQIIEVEIDGRADIYSLGVSMYHMLAGAPPFSGDDVRHSHLHVTPKPIKGVSDWMNTVVLKCLRKEPDGRWCNAEELRDVLKGNKDIGVSMQGFSQPWWLRARDHEEMAARMSALPKPGAEEPEAPKRRRLAVESNPPPIRSSGVSARVERISNHSDIIREGSEHDGSRAIMGLLGGLTAGAILTIFDGNSSWSLPQGLLFQLSWIVYGILIGIATGLVKRPAIKGLLPPALGLIGGTTSYFLLRLLGGIEALQSVDPIYYSVLCAATLGVFLGISEGACMRSHSSTRCVGLPGPQ